MNLGVAHRLLSVGARLELRDERRASTRETAHDGADRRLEHLRGLAVRQALDGDEREHGTLLLGQKRERALDLEQRQFAERHRFAADDGLLAELGLAVGALPHLMGPAIVDPQVAANFEHPAQELDVLGKAFLEYAFDRRLH